MGFNFPNSPSLGQSYSPAGGYQYVWDGTGWRVVEAPQLRATAQARNRIVNGAMQISQETGGVDTSVAHFPADQWGLYFQGTGMTCTAGRFGTNSKYIRLYNNAIKSGLAAGDVAIFYQYVEGTRIADFYWGTPYAGQAILSFSAWASVTGTYGLSITNRPATRSYVRNLPLVANVTKRFDIVIPGDTAGTWATDNSAGLSIQVAHAAHSAQLAPTEGWHNDGTYRGVTGMSNGMATLNASLSLADVGLYFDPDNTGLPPKWETPDEAEELRACQRYYYKTPTAMPVPPPATPASLLVQFKTSMRAIPAVTGGGAGFATSSGNNDWIQVNQTTLAYQSLIFNARM